MRIARLVVGSILLGLLSSMVGTVAVAAPAHPRHAWQQALTDGTVEQAVALASDLDASTFDARVDAFLAALKASPGGERLVDYLATVADPADVLRSLLGTSQMGAASTLGFADSWMAPAPPTTTTLGTRATLATTASVPHAPSVLLVASIVDESVGLPGHRDRFPAVQPLGP
ncbi:MAG: hypothetical protein AAF809_00720 [Bacteroidota bacterium]